LIYSYTHNDKKIRYTFEAAEKALDTKFEWIHAARLPYERPMLEYIESLGIEGVYLDVGANIGNHAMFFAAHCPATRVAAIEPHPIIYQVLCDNVALNNMEGLIDRVPLFVGSALDPEIVVVGMTGPRSKMDENGVVRDLNASVKGDHDYARVGKVTLDQIYEAHTQVDERVGLVKIDVEGHELEVVRGGRKLFKKGKPEAVFVEVLEDLKDQVDDVMADCGYRCERKMHNETPTYHYAVR
tara:strand:- start:1385 stop:2107 length:723 start_codon:yes stop_codon:yes gene_type:complete